ncbi:MULTISPECIES: Imm52 family immunity protein [Stenotrophomonas]|uniref:Imm52 family immunity protein n=1 Tax=Stenotrophomonas TaxID=40323 RepID=UPI0018D48365|nr:Imm52 family immunity protein [Stenotrophomonas sp.]MBH1509648.1 immunity 52 family protein [Stenotrophomonas maltophilia]
MILGVETKLWTTPVSKTPDELLRIAVNLTALLAEVHPLMNRWYALPSSSKEDSIPLDDENGILAQMAQKIQKNRKRFGDFEELGASVMLSNVDNDRDWKKPGVVVLGLNPTTGFNFLSVDGIDPFGASLPSLLRNALTEMVKVVGPFFAATDVKARSPDKGLVDYQLDRRLYQHRRFFGWMGFVPAQIAHAQIRDAHAVHPVDGLGTVIVSVPGVFDPTDDAQVDKVHRVEMDLASYDLLPVTDPHFKG